MNGPAVLGHSLCQGTGWRSEGGTPVRCYCMPEACDTCGAPVGLHGVGGNCSACWRTAELDDGHYPGDALDLVLEADGPTREVLDEALAALGRVGRQGEMSFDRSVVRAALEVFGKKAGLL